MWELRWSRSWDDDSTHGSMVNEDINLIIMTAVAAIQEGSKFIVIEKKEGEKE